MRKINRHICRVFEPSRGNFTLLRSNFLILNRFDVHLDPALPRMLGQIDSTRIILTIRGKGVRYRAHREYGLNETV